MGLSLRPESVAAPEPGTLGVLLPIFAVLRQLLIRPPTMKGFATGIFREHPGDLRAGLHPSKDTSEHAEEKTQVYVVCAAHADHMYRGPAVTPKLCSSSGARPSRFAGAMRGEEQSQHTRLTA